MNNHEINKRIAEIEDKEILLEDADGVLLCKHPIMRGGSPYNPVGNWIQGGELIEKYKVTLQPLYKFPSGEFMGWNGILANNNELAFVGESDVDESPLKAAMLAIIEKFAD